MITINLNEGQARVRLNAILERTRRPRSIMQAAARGVRKRLQAHFRDRDKTPNRLGGRRTHFWLDILRSTQIGDVKDNLAVVSIGDHRFAQKVFGGRIRAKLAKALTIPVDPEAHGRRPEVFERETGLELIFIKQRTNALLATRAENSEALQVRYILTPQVDQEPDQEALPPHEEMQAAALTAAETQLTTEILRRTR